MRKALLLTFLSVLLALPAASDCVKCGSGGGGDGELSANDISNLAFFDLNLCTSAEDSVVQIQSGVWACVDNTDQGELDTAIATATTAWENYADGAVTAAASSVTIISDYATITGDLASGDMWHLQAAEPGDADLCLTSDPVTDEAFCIRRDTQIAVRVPETFTQASIEAAIAVCDTGDTETGCIVDLPRDGAATLTSTITVTTSGTQIRLNGSTLTWGGTPGDPMFVFGGNQTVYYSGIEGPGRLLLNANSASETDDAGACIKFTANTGDTNQFGYAKDFFCVGDSDNNALAGTKAIIIDGQTQTEQTDKVTIERVWTDGVETGIYVNSSNALEIAIKESRIYGTDAGIHVENGGVRIQGGVVGCRDSACAYVIHNSGQQSYILHPHSEVFDDTKTWLKMNSGAGNASTGMLDRKVYVEGLHLNADCTAPCRLQIVDATSVGDVKFSGQVVSPNSGNERTLVFDFSGGTDGNSTPLLDLSDFDRLDHLVEVNATLGAQYIAPAFGGIAPEEMYAQLPTLAEFRGDHSHLTKYYFDADSGSDSNPCTKDLPCETLDLAETIANQGNAHILLANGDTWTGATDFGSGLVFSDVCKDEGNTRDLCVLVSAVDPYGTRPIIDSTSGTPDTAGCVVSLCSGSTDSCGWVGIENVDIGFCSEDAYRFGGSTTTPGKMVVLNSDATV